MNLQSANLQKKENHERSAAEPAKTESAGAELENGTGAVAGLPLFMQSTLSFSATPPFPTPTQAASSMIQRQAVEEEEEEDHLQAKYGIGRPEDRYEREADRVADRVVRMPVSGDRPVSAGAGSGKGQTGQGSAAITPFVPQAHPSGRQQPQFLHASDRSHAAARRPGSDIQPLSGTGQPLPESARNFFEPRFGYDFSDVRIHTDAAAGASAERIHAKAYTLGRDIVFSPGAYAPHTIEGKTLIAHELTHVCQQSIAVEDGGIVSEPSGQPQAKETLPVSADTSHTIRRDLTAGDIWDATGGRVVSGIVEGAETVGSAVSEGVEELGELAGEAYERTAAYFAEVVEQYAPGLMAILRSDFVATIKEQIIDRLGGTFSRLYTSISRDGVVETLRTTFSEVAAGMVQIAGELGSGACSALTSAARALMDFRRELAGEAIAALRSALSTISGFFRDIWEQFGAPAVEAISTFAGDVWTWIEEQAAWVWEQTEPVRTAVVEAWNWLMEQFDIAWNTAGDVIGWLRDKAVEAWDEIMALIEPIKGPLLVAGTILLLVSPLGPFVLAGAGAYGLWYGLNWLWENWDDLEVVIRAREMLHETILPAISTGVQWLQSALSDAVAWLSEAMDTVVAALNDLMDALGITALLNAVSEAVAYVAELFESLRDWAQAELVPIINDVRDVLAQVFEFVRPLLVVLGAILLLPVNPWFFAMVVAGWAWQALPNCLKAVIIDFVLDTMILALEISPDFSTFGEAWATAKQGIIQLLRDTLAMDTAAKIEMADRVARVMTGQDIEWIGNLIQAAGQMPGQFEGQVQQELIGMDLTQPLPFERTAPPDTVQAADTAVESGALSAEDHDLLTRETLTEDDIEVDGVGDLQLDPEFIASLNLGDTGEIEFGDSSDPSRSIEAIREELTGSSPSPEAEGTPTASTEEPDTEAQLQALMDQPGPEGCPDEAPSQAASQGEVPESLRIGPLTRGQRARYLMNQMWKGMRKWFSCNWQWLVPTLIGVLIVLIVLEIVTGGAVTAALPPLMEILGALFIGIAIVRSAYYLGEYIAKGVSGDIAGAARSLARALAVAAVELVFALLFNLSAVIRSLRAGLRESLRAVAKTVSTTARRTSQAVSRLGQVAAGGMRTAATNIGRVSGAILRRGKLVMTGVGDAIGQGVRNLDDLARRLWRRVRFRRFKIRRFGIHFQLWGYINPWVLVASGDIEQVRVSGSRPSRGMELSVAGRRKSGFLVGVRDSDVSAFMQHLNGMSRNQRRALYRQMEGMSEEARRAFITGLSATAENARVLRGSMLQGGVRAGRGTPKSGYAAHHIVPSTHGYGSAVEARQILDDLGIHFNDGLNGVFVSPAIHAHLHTHAYMDAVADALRGVSDRPQAIQILDDIAERIRANNFP